MKTSILALVSIAFATAAQAHYPAITSITSSANVSGAINNNVSSSAFATGLNDKLGSSSSGAGSSASTTATATVGSQHSEPNTSYGGWKGSIDAQVSGSTNTKIDGYGFNVSTGTGTGGSGTAAGWSDAGSNAKVTGTLYQNLYQNLGKITVSGQSDTGHPTFNAHGPDLALAVGTNQAAAGVAGAGGTYAVTGHVDINKNYTAGQVSGAAADTKVVSDYAFAVPLNFGPNNAVLNGKLVNNTAITALNAGSESTGSAAGSFATSIQNVTGNFSGPTAPVFTNAAN